MQKHMSHPRRYDQPVWCEMCQRFERFTSRCKVTECPKLVVCEGEERLVNSVNSCKFCCLCESKLTVMVTMVENLACRAKRCHGSLINIKIYRLVDASSTSPKCRDVCVCTNKFQKLIGVEWLVGEYAHVDCT